MANETAGEGALQKPTQPPTFQDVIMNLQRYWAEPGLRRAAALRQRGGRGHVPHGHDAALARARRVAVRLRAALPPSHRRPLRREPQPHAALLPVPGHPEAFAGQRAGPVPGQPARHRHPRGGARRALRGGRLGKPDAGRVGPGLGSVDRRHGGHAVHVLPTGGRVRMPPRARRDHLRPGAPDHVHPGRRFGLRHRVEPGRGRVRVHLRRRVPGKRARVLRLQLRGGRHRPACSASSTATRPNATACWRPGCRLRPTTTC